MKNNTLSERTKAFFDKITQQGLERRDGQVEMALEICDAIEGRKPIVTEAEVGIGKSYAYLVPAVMQYEKEHKQIVIATSTIALQEQLAIDAQIVMEITGINAPVIIAKGMKNYVCEKRLQTTMYIADNKEKAVLKKVSRYVSKGIQQRSDMDINIPDEIWNRICIARYGDKCRNCRCNCNCEYKRLREKLSHTNAIVICNQNLLVAHLMSGTGIFNDNCCLTIVDEAHDLEPKFREAFTESYSKSELLWKINAAVECALPNRKRDARKAADTSITLTEQLFELLKHQVREQRARRDGDNKAYYLKCTKDIRALLLGIIRRLEQLERITHYSLEREKRFLTAVLKESRQNILWLECDRYLKICICKKDIRFYISQMLFHFCQTTVLTSATMTDKSEGTLRERYGYFLISLGFPIIGKLSEPKRSPFDYDSNTMLYISDKLPYPNLRNKAEYREKAIAEILQLLSITHGKTLILFTSKEDMEYVYKKLVNLHLPYRIIIQGENSSQAHKIRRFKDEINSVLLGTGTYWEGINVEGKSLSQVIIFKLPFPVPNPILDYKMSLARNRKRDVALPEMIIKLRQGAGRLIRSATDKGIVSILDPRASIREDKPYRNRILAALSEKNVTESIDDLRIFWKRISENRKAE